MCLQPKKTPVENLRSHPAARSLCLPLAVCCLLAACEDKALVEKNKALLDQVAAAEAELAEIENRAGENPGDQSAPLEQCKRQLDEADSKLAELRAAAAADHARNDEAKKAFRRYRAKYPVE